MRHHRLSLWMLVLLFVFASSLFGENDQLKYFLNKANSKSPELSKKEKADLLNRIEEILGQGHQIHARLTQIIQSGETDLRYQEGRYWMSKLEKDRESIDVGIEQIKLLRENPMHLIASIKLYKSLKDLSSNYNACNNMPAFSAHVGDLAPEMELWADPVLYKLYLLPLAETKGSETKPPQKKPVTKGKKS